VCGDLVGKEAPIELVASLDGGLDETLKGELVDQARRSARGEEDLPCGLVADEVGLHAGAIEVESDVVAWRPRGDVSNWLTSDVFDLGYARSREAEDALNKAVKVLDRPELSDGEERSIHRELHNALGDTDPFWARWLAYARTKGIEP